MVSDKIKDFSRAQDACRTLNMTLVSIHSNDENIFIQKILGDKVRNEVVRAAWIGLKRVQWKAADTGLICFFYVCGGIYAVLFIH